jgi:hypothetical protein
MRQIDFVRQIFEPMDSSGGAFFVDYVSIEINNRTTLIVGLIPNLGRLLLTLVFFCSYLVSPLQYTISLLCVRIVESDRPVFTLLFGGIAAIAKSVQATLENL